MDIKDILNSLGLDLSNPEVKKGAMEAIDAILASRIPIGGGDFGGGGKEVEIEVDPDLIQPSIKQAPPRTDIDMEVDDEEKLLNKIKHKDSEPAEQNTLDEPNEPDEPVDLDEPGEPSKSDKPDKSSDPVDPDEPGEPGDPGEPDDSSNLDDDPDEQDKPDEFSEPDDEDKTDESGGTDEFGDLDELEEPEDDELIDPDTDEESNDFDEDDILDDTLKDSTEDKEQETKHNARKIKRERTLAAAKKALADAQAKKVSPALIRELEKSIEALEALTEAVAKSLKDISDEEFNQLVNRVFDAIDACGGSDLTFTSEEERAAQVKEIKDDIAKATTQAELSAEDAAKIRAETQAVKAREKEANKYAGIGRSTFKGFQDFLNSLYRAIALQVSNEETRDDSWSAISRRNSGAGVLRQGQKVNDLPNKKIPIIDFYFDCSASWGADDIAVGKKAISALADMEKDGKIKVNIYYFSDTVSQNYSDVAGGGTYAWNYIIKNIIATQATNVVIMTDWDMERQGKHEAGEQNHLKYTVPGYVWYLWKNGENAPRLPRDLKGRGGVQQFSFNINDV